MPKRLLLGSQMAHSRLLDSQRTGMHPSRAATRWGVSVALENMLVLQVNFDHFPLGEDPPPYLIMRTKSKKR